MVGSNDLRLSVFIRGSKKIKNFKVWDSICPILGDKLEA